MQATSWTRRQFIRASLVAGAGLSLAACGQAASPAPSASSAAAAKPASPSTVAASAKPAGSAATSAAPASSAGGSAAASPAGSAKPAAGAAKPSLNKVTILFNAPHEPDFVPDFSGYKALTDAGIQADVKDITGADASIKALVAGQAQFALSSMASGILAVGQGQKIKAAVPSDDASYFTMVATNDIKDWPDLKGKRIGITANSDASYWMSLMQLKKRNIDDKSVQWLTVRGSAARVEALVAGKLDAAQVTVGGWLQVAKAGKFHRIGDFAKDFPNMLFNASWVSDQFAQEHPDVIQTFAEIMMQQHRLVQDQSKYLTLAKEVLPKETQAEAPDAYPILKDMNIWDPDEKRWANDTGGEFTSKALADYGAVEKYIPFDQWATTKFVDAARQKLGPYKSGS
jgi:NitT/TauT family transport system substrate-binding protein